MERTLAAPDWATSDPLHPHRRRAFGALPERDGRIPRLVNEGDGEAWEIVTAFLDRTAVPPP